MGVEGTNTKTTGLRFCCTEPSTPWAPLLFPNQASNRRSEDCGLLPKGPGRPASSERRRAVASRYVTRSPGSVAE